MSNIEIFISVRMHMNARVNAFCFNKTMNIFGFHSHRTLMNAFFFCLNSADYFFNSPVRESIERINAHLILLRNSLLSDMSTTNLGNHPYGEAVTIMNFSDANGKIEINESSLDSLFDNEKVKDRKIERKFYLLWEYSAKVKATSSTMYCDLCTEM